MPALSDSSNQDGRHVGELRLDSPGLWQLLWSHLAPIDAHALASLYRAVAQLGGLADSPVQRAQGVSFNPRPARICHILGAQGRQWNPQALAAAMLACLSPEAALSLVRTETPPLVSGLVAVELIAERFSWIVQVREPKSLLEAVGSDDSPTYLEAHLVAVEDALLIDLLRHLHMTAWTPIERKSVLDRIHRSLDRPGDQQLSAVLATALNQAVRRNNRETQRPKSLAEM